MQKEELKNDTSIQHKDVNRKVKRHNSFYGGVIRLLKLVLPIIAISLTAILILWPLLEENEEFEAFTEDLDIDTTKLQVFGVSYGGYGQDGDPYQITADRAIQDNPDSPIITLLKPTGDIILGGEQWYAVSAPEGQIDQTANTLVLSGGVFAYQDQGFEFNTETIFLDLSNRSALTNTAVEAYGPGIYMSSEAGIEIVGQGETVKLLGKSKLVYSDQSNTIDANN